MMRRPALAPGLALATLLAATLLAAIGPACAQDIMALVHARAWAQADAAAAGLADPVVAKLVAFYRVLTPQAARLADAEAFLAGNPDWPLQAGLARRRDEALAAESDDALVLTACDRAAPQSAAALARCAEAGLRQNRPERAVRDAQAAWVAANPDPVWEAAFLRGWGPSIGPEQHWQRFERLAWTDAAAAARVAGALSAADRPAAEAWLAARHDDPRAGELADAVAAPRATAPLLVLERLRWMRRAGHDPQALALWTGAGTAAEQAEAAEHRPAFWDERNLLARRRLRDGDAAGAYALSAETVQTAPEQAADAAFLAGWIALRRLGDPARARTHFASLTQLSAAALTQSRGQYWLGRAAQAAGDAAAASEAFAAAAAWPATFYGQLAARDGGANAAKIAAARDPRWSRTQALAFSSRELVRAAAWLVAWGEPQRAAVFLFRVAELSHDPAEFALAAHLAAGLRMPETAVALARRAGRAGIVLLEAGWPVAAAIPAEPKLDAALALAVIRQESSFDTTTTSPAGARGLMQLMPATAAQIGRQLGLEAPAAALVTDPALNIRLGTAYLRGMLERFDGAVPLAVAAYNAGPNRVAEWLGVNGDPRIDADMPRMIDWIELIPFAETRNYVQRVIENTVVYRARLGEKPENPLG